MFVSMCIHEYIFIVIFIYIQGACNGLKKIVLPHYNDLQVAVIIIIMIMTIIK